MRLDGAWTGVFGVARDWAAAVHCDRDSGLCWAGGYAGEGVAAANLAARTLRDLILDRDTELARLPWVGHHARDWEPEPLRWLAVQTVYGAFRTADAIEDRTGGRRGWRGPRARWPGAEQHHREKSVVAARVPEALAHERRVTVGNRG